ncbi:response regulator [Alphaproteobacteria bacterium]|nr:response regulator [Alphaproteobacteria bacterium]
MPNILIIDDEIDICKQVSITLTDEGYHASYVMSSDECLNELSKNNYDIVLVDLWLKNSTLQGNQLISHLSSIYNELIIISFSGHANIDNAIDSLKSGAHDFIEKPFETKKLLHVISKNLEFLKNKITIDNYRNKMSFHTKINYIGCSDEISLILNKINKFNKKENIFISGPSGIGKFFLANLIHNNISNNNFDTFINLNEIILSFDDILKLNSIHNYFTIYVNDIDKFTGSNIRKLNNFIIDNNINASIIIDSHHDSSLNEYDFFNITFKLKALKFRNDEILNIFNHYLNLFSQKLLNKKISIDENCNEKLINYDWPGNIFQLMNITENLVKNINPLKNIIKLEDIKIYINDMKDENKLYDLSYKDARNTFEKDYLINKLKTNGWNVTKTASVLGLDRVSLYRKIKSLKINLTE